MYEALSCFVCALFETVKKMVAYGVCLSVRAAAANAC